MNPASTVNVSCLALKSESPLGSPDLKSTCNSRVNHIEHVDLAVLASTLRRVNAQPYLALFQIPGKEKDQPMSFTGLALGVHRVSRRNTLPVRLLEIFHQFNSHVRLHMDCLSVSQDNRA